MVRSPLGVGLALGVEVEVAAAEKDGAAYTQNMALSAMLFLYQRVLGYAMTAGGEFPFHALR